jgi:hypothetical protein
MITEVTDLERLLGQYDSGVVLVGPLLRLSMNSSYRYFYIAGKGSKVYQATVGLGVIESETAAQKQRADVVKELESCFAEVLTFAGDVAMLQAVRARWPEEENVAVWIPPPAATFESMKVAGRQTIDDGGHAGVQLGVHGERPIDTEEPADNVEDALSTYGLPRVRNQSQLMPVVHLAPTLTPLSALVASATQSPTGDRVGMQQRRSGASQGGIQSRASTILRFCAIGGIVVAVSASLILVNRYKNMLQAALAVAPSVPNQLAETTVSALEVTASPAKALLPPKSQPSPAASAQDWAAPTTAPAPPKSQPSPIANGQDGAAPTAALRPPKSEATQIANGQDRAAPTTAPAPPKSQPSPIANGQDGAAPTIAPAPPKSQPSPAASGQDGAALTASLPAPKFQPSQAASARDGAAALPPLQPQVARAQNDLAPVSEPQSPPVPASSSAKRLDAAEVAMLVNRGMEYLKNGDFPSARLLLKRAANAGSPSAALMLGATFDPLFLPRIRLDGIEPDVAQARQWYEKALELGSEGASQRLTELERIGK